VSNIQSAGTGTDATNMLVRLVDFLRKQNILAFLVSLSSGGKTLETTDEAMSSIVDTWLLLRDVEVSGERNRLIYVLKSRGIAHSNQVREFLITSKGVDLNPAYLGAAGVLTGSARLIQEARDAAEQRMMKDELSRKKLAIEHRRKAAEAQIAALRAELRSEEEEFERAVDMQREQLERMQVERAALSGSRKVAGAVKK
jgi:circadian clock protein KaiC